MEEVHATVEGRVQGVMFRHFLKERAQEFGLSGTVENLENGSLEVIAQGPKEKLERFVIFLRKGPPQAQISRVHIEWRVPHERLENFQILP